jgi:peptidoglycan LD-endopeptidase LytH
MDISLKPHRRGISILVKILAALGIMIILILGFFIYRRVGIPSKRTALLMSWLNHPEEHKAWMLEANSRCGDAFFQMPTNGYIGFIWGDSFQIGHSHQGLDIFGGTNAGQTHVYAAYSGYLTRLPDWKSAVIIRIPQDPLEPDRQIWTYYAHMADPAGKSFISSDFPASTSEQYVEAGTLLGYQGNYSGDPLNPTGVHLHFSIVKDDGKGKWLNEQQKKNTLDPSLYFGMDLNAETNPDQVPGCQDK